MTETKCTPCGRKLLLHPGGAEPVQGGEMIKLPGREPEPHCNYCIYENIVTIVNDLKDGIAKLPTPAGQQ